MRREERVYVRERMVERGGKSEEGRYRREERGWNI